MPVSKQQVLTMASLVRLDLHTGFTEQESDEFISRLAQEMGEVVSFMDSISQVDTSNVSPLYSPALCTAPLREDKAQVTLTPDEVLANAPEKQDTFFCVPPVL